MRIHALESSGGLTYAEMGRFLAADDPENPAGTSDEEAALTDEEGNPVPNAARNTWVTETSLSTALNLSYMAEQLALFGIVVGDRPDPHRHRLPGARDRRRAAPLRGQRPESREGGARVVVASLPAEAPSRRPPGGSAFSAT